MENYSMQMKLMGDKVPMWIVEKVNASVAGTQNSDLGFNMCPLALQLVKD